MNSKVSVIMPAYNAERHIGQAIGSILGQKDVDFELIVVDDGSTDGTRAIARDWYERDSRVIVVCAVGNHGPSAARNRGLRSACGKYIAYQDADDYSLPGRLCNQVALLDERGDVGVVDTNFWLMDRFGRQRLARQIPSGPAGNRHPKTVTRLELLCGDPVCCGSVMHRRELLEKTGWWQGDEVDWGMWVRMQEHAQVVNMPSASYVYRYDLSGSISHVRGYAKNQHIAVTIMRRCRDRTGEADASRTLWKHRFMLWAGWCLPGLVRFRVVQWGINAAASLLVGRTPWR